MFENWQKLVSTEKIVVLFFRISLLHFFFIIVNFLLFYLYLYHGIIMEQGIRNNNNKSKIK